MPVSICYPSPFDTSSIQPRILLHACCAPCSAAIIEALLQVGVRPTVFFYNPNIYPRTEYELRKTELARYLHTLAIPYVDADYDHATWLAAIRGYEHEPERGLRCAQCFVHRLDVVAAFAAQHGFDLFTSTLASSRWKDLDQIHAAGRGAAARYKGPLYWEQNWRKGGLTERRAALLRQNAFYNQTYCGCEFSLAQMRAFQEEKTKKYRGEGGKI